MILRASATGWPVVPLPRRGTDAGRDMGRSTLRRTDPVPISGLNDGRAFSTVRSSASRSSGTAQISECTVALTSAHHDALVTWVIA